ncbi:ssDNA-binding protein [Polynucleobacter sphagniphilus]|jgi:hypothetical protein|uniref:Uncharacterized protein n=1 Tax=Polynucleobacter sphagniphilus TaxID=1743169 RepID=A0AA43S4T2_9BURK|nr:hypothetical protein [Polynucleobacter sphagniphilus]MDH6512066.1 hypothetical protein [Polynucleobacter sphagniphilus]
MYWVRGGFIEGADPECWYLTATSQRVPGLVDSDLNPIIDRAEVYARCTGRVSITAFTYEVLGSFGVSFGLNNIMKQPDGSEFINSTVGQRAQKEVPGSPLKIPTLSRPISVVVISMHRILIKRSVIEKLGLCLIIIFLMHFRN